MSRLFVQYSLCVFTIRNANSFAECDLNTPNINLQMAEKGEEMAAVTTAISAPVPKEHHKVSGVRALD